MERRLAPTCTYIWRVSLFTLSAVKANIAKFGTAKHSFQFSTQRVGIRIVKHNF